MINNVFIKQPMTSNGEEISINFSVNVSSDYYKTLHHLLRLYKLTGENTPKLIRVGDTYDGGYIMLDDFSSDGVAYSFGICEDVSWDEAMANRGYQVYMYDHTINALPKENERFHFFKSGIGADDQSSVDLKTLEYYLQRNSHVEKQHMILKMDVEGAEWGSFATMRPSILEQFDQIVLEIHDLLKMCSPEMMKYRLSVLQKLNHTHQMIHIHGNNGSFQMKIDGKVFPDLIEVCYVRRGLYPMELADDVCLPLPIDNPNVPRRPEIELGYWNDGVML